MGTPIPHHENETRERQPSQYNSYFLSPEELEREKARLATRMPQIRSERVNTKPSITRDRYIELRARGESRADIKLKHFGNRAATMKGFLEAWDLMDPSKEKTEVELFQQRNGIEPPVPNKRTLRTRSPKTPREVKPKLVKEPRERLRKPPVIKPPRVRKPVTRVRRPKLLKLQLQVPIPDRSIDEQLREIQELTNRFQGQLDRDLATWTSSAADLLEVIKAFAGLIGSELKDTKLSEYFSGCSLPSAKVVE
ncbi:hypothetical protein [Cohnella soli]|uniref:Uncharacterized protein n=1 Tax=Cohnella soli TaxID=425005 RepID=A0ABW0HQE3_9BACL